MDAHSASPDEVEVTDETEAHELHAAFLRALADEMKEVDARRHSGVALCGHGRLTHRSGGTWRYRFEGPVRTAGVRPGGEIGFETNEELHAGRVLQCTDAHVLVELSTDLGMQTPPGRLLLDKRWLLASLARRVRDIDATLRNGRRNRFNSEAALRLVGAGDLSIPACERPAHVAVSPLLNAEQQRLVELAHRALAVYLWGPAGTGKTETLLALVLSLLDSGLRVLYVGPTNMSVDDLIERGASHFRAASWHSDGSVLRVGPIDSVTLRSTLRDEFCIGSVLLRRLGQSLPSCDAYEREASSAVRSSRLLCTTIHQTWLSPLLTNGSWDVLVADEASMISPIGLYVAGGLAQRTVIAGDFRQLPPVAHSTSLDARTWLRRDAFEMVGIPQDVERGDYPEYLVMLKRQYRMAPAICDLVAGAYDHQLITDASVLDRARGPLGADGVLFIDSGPRGANVEVEPSGSRLNPCHAQMTVELLERMIARQALSTHELKEILVITPFVAQARLLATRMRARFGRMAPAIRTIHGCQGREASIVLVDLVDARNERPSVFYAGRDMNSETARLLTVAITRAREHLVVIGDMHHMQCSREVGRVAREIVASVVAEGRSLRWGQSGRSRAA